jgi:hypothetical protein
MQFTSTEMSPVEHSHKEMLVAFKWSTRKKERRSILTGALGVIKVDFSHRRRVLEHSNVTCGESTAIIVGKKRLENEAGGDRGERAYQ